MSDIRSVRGVTRHLKVQKELEIHVSVIQALQSKSPVTGQLDYSVIFYAIIDGPWQAVRQNGSLSLIPNDELQTYAWFHQILTSLMGAMHAAEQNLGSSGTVGHSEHVPALRE